MNNHQTDAIKLAIYRGLASHSLSLYFDKLYNIKFKYIYMRTNLKIVKKPKSSFSVKIISRISRPTAHKVLPYKSYTQDKVGEVT